MLEPPVRDYWAHEIPGNFLPGSFGRAGGSNISSYCRNSLKLGDLLDNTQRQISSKFQQIPTVGTNIRATRPRLLGPGNAASRVVSGGWL